MTYAQTDWLTLLTIVGLTVVTVLTRGFFFISSKPWKLPHWAERGLQYAPIAALSAVITPEIIMAQGQLTGLADARLYGALAGAGYFFWRKGTLGCIVVGMAVYLPLKMGLGW